MRRFVWLIAVLLVAGPAAAQGVPPVDENGEDIFGPGFMPRATQVEGLPLYLAKPNAGLELPSEVLLLRQDAFQPDAPELSLPVETFQRRFPRGVPLLRSVREKLAPEQRPRLEQQARVSTIPFAVTAPMKVHYVFVGQGAGAIVELPCGLAVVDVGGGRDQGDGGKLFADYLRTFLAEHPQYHGRIDVIFLSHAHEDHLLGTKNLMELLDPAQIGSLVDNGQEGDDRGLLLQTEFRNWAVAGGANYTKV